MGAFGTKPNTVVRVLGDQNQLFSDKQVDAATAFYRQQSSYQANGDVAYVHKVVQQEGMLLDYMRNLESESFTVKFVPPTEERKVVEEVRPQQIVDVMLDGYIAVSVTTYGPSSMNIKVELNGAVLCDSPVPIHPIGDSGQFYANTFLFTFGKDALRSRSFRNDKSPNNPNRTKLLNKIIPALPNKHQPHRPNLLAYPMFEATPYDYGYILQPGSDTGGNVGVYSVQTIQQQIDFPKINSSPLVSSGANTLTITAYLTSGWVYGFGGGATPQIQAWAEFYERGKLRPVLISWHQVSDNVNILVNDTPSLFVNDRALGLLPPLTITGSSPEQVITTYYDQYFGHTLENIVVYITTIDAINYTLNYPGNPSASYNMSVDLTHSVNTGLYWQQP